MRVTLPLWGTAAVLVTGAAFVVLLVEAAALVPANVPAEAVGAVTAAATLLAELVALLDVAPLLGAAGAVVVTAPPQAASKAVPASPRAVTALRRIILRRVKPGFVVTTPLLRAVAPSRTDRCSKRAQCSIRCVRRYAWRIWGVPPVIPRHPALPYQNSPASPPDSSAARDGTDGCTLSTT